MTWYQPELWDAIDDEGAVRYEVWVYSVDNGAVFRGGTTELVGPIVQFGFTSETDRESWALLAEAAERLPACAAGSALATVSFSLDEEWSEPRE